MKRCCVHLFRQDFGGWLRFVLCAVVGCFPQLCVRATDTVLERHVELTATVSVQSHTNGSVKVWIPVPQSSSFQSTEQVIRHQDLPLQLTAERRYGNEMLYGEESSAESGRLDFEITWKVSRRQVRGNDLPEPERLLTLERTIWLQGSPRIPIGGKPLELLDALTLPDRALGQARLFYDRVLEHMRYDKSRPGYGTGDAVWACDSRFGNCTDFHSLFMSLARSHGIPARFEIGYPLPADRNHGDISGYHCWAWFHELHDGWAPVDISEADKHPELSDFYFGNLPADRIAFSVGRDLVLEPPQQGDPLNFFVTPYAEVDGSSIADRDVAFSLSFHDVDIESLE